jgi:hypothetical protein
MPSVVSVLLGEAGRVTGTRRCRAAGWSRDGSDVSQDRDGWPQIRWLAVDSALRETMIGPIARCPVTGWLTDWSSVSTGYRSAYPSSYTHVYNQQKEVLQ